MRVFKIAIYHINKENRLAVYGINKEGSELIPALAVF
jgi:hypothetical protein